MDWFEEEHELTLPSPSTPSNPSLLFILERQTLSLLLVLPESKPKLWLLFLRLSCLSTSDVRLSGVSIWHSISSSGTEVFVRRQPGEKGKLVIWFKLLAPINMGQPCSNFFYGPSHTSTKDIAGQSDIVYPASTTDLRQGSADIKAPSLIITISLDPHPWIAISLPNVFCLPPSLTLRRLKFMRVQLI